MLIEAEINMKKADKKSLLTIKIDDNSICEETLLLFYK